MIICERKPLNLLIGRLWIPRVRGEWARNSGHGRICFRVRVSWVVDLTGRWFTLQQGLHAACELQSLRCRNAARRSTDPSPCLTGKRWPRNSEYCYTHQHSSEKCNRRELGVDEIISRTLNLVFALALGVQILHELRAPWIFCLCHPLSPHKNMRSKMETIEIEEEI